MPTVDHTKNIVEVKGVSYSYEHAAALRDISLDIHQGDYIGIIGPNGAGKTTLIKIMLGLLIPQGGSVKLFGQDIKKFKDWQKISYVPQKAASFAANFPVTVREVAAMGGYASKRLLHKTAAEDRELIESALKQVDMWEYRNRLIGELSGGQAQRVFIARALVNRPEIIFLDEPTTGVDRAIQDSFYKMLQKLNREFGLTLVLISHDIERITKEVMHIACVDQTLTCHLSPEEYLKESRSADIMGEKVKIIAHHHHGNDK